MNIDHVNADTLSFLKGLTNEKLSLANFIKTVREGEGLSQTVFAEQLGITRHRLCDIEHGGSRLSPKLSAEFAKKLGYSESQFVRLALQDAA